MLKMSKSLKPRCPQRHRNRINPPSKSLEIFRIYFFLYSKKFNKKLGLINQPTATNGLMLLDVKVTDIIYTFPHLRHIYHRVLTMIFVRHSTIPLHP